MRHLLNLMLLLVLTAKSTNAQTSAKPELIRIEGGSFNMGSGDGNNASNLDEKPAHRVTVSSFNMGKFPVTVAEYKAYCQATGTQLPPAPSWGWKDRHPMVNVSFNDATAYCNWLRKVHNGNYRLPTEAEWEYAARGGNKSGGYVYAGSNDLDEVGWFIGNSAAGNETNPVGSKKPNELGLYDMSGSVNEWCQDWHGAYPSEAQANPKGAETGSRRVLRGGSWFDASVNSRVAARRSSRPHYRYNVFGFRVVVPE